ncbi:DUF2294 family protein [Cytobacillus suaedae]|nr:DUF2294 family protein [Cytobacillus suaedae]
MELNDKLTYISSYCSKALRKNFGRGPHSCQSTLNNNYLVLYVRGFISPMEEVLIQQKQNDYVENARNIIITHIIEELKGVVQVTLEVDMEEYYQDWNFPNNSGIIILVLESEISHSEIEIEYDKGEIEKEIGRISALVQKVPNCINSIPISQNIVLIERKGILIPIEKALIARGFSQELIVTKDELEKKYFHRYGKFEVIFNKSIRDIFIDWNLKEDKSFMCFVLG